MENPEEEATLQWNVIEFVKDIARLGGSSCISPDTIPGGVSTAEEAVRQGMLAIQAATKNGTYIVYQLTFSGLLLYWDNCNPEENFLISLSVAQY